MRRLIACAFAFAGLLIGGCATAGAGEMPGEMAGETAGAVAGASKNESQAAAIEAWYRDYAADWFDADIDPEAVAKFYASPFYYLASTGPLLDTSETQIASLEAYAQEWKDLGWVGSKLLDVKVKVLNDSSAIVLTEWHIHDDADETIIGCDRAPWTYLVSKDEAGDWKLTLEVEIACGQGIVIQ